MLRSGLLTEAQLARALSEHARVGRPLGEIVIRLGLASPAAVANALADQFGAPVRTEYGLGFGTPAASTPPRRGANGSDELAAIRAELELVRTRLATALESLDGVTRERDALVAELRRRREVEEAERRPPPAEAKANAAAPAAPLRRLDHGFFEHERRPQLGAALLRKGLITGVQLDTALAEGRRTGERLGAVLVRLGYVFETDLARTLAEQAGVEYVDLSVRGFDTSLLRLVPAGTASRFRAVPIRQLADGGLVVAVEDPTDDLSELRRALAVPLRFVVTEPSNISAALAQRRAQA